MLSLDDPKWKKLKGGYNTPYDASGKLRSLENTDDPKEVEKILKEFWNNLYHQGDVNLSSYLSLPHLIRIAKSKTIPNWDIPALVAVVEIARHKNNPQLPLDLVAEYENEIKGIVDVVKMRSKDTWDKTYTIAALSAIAAAFGQIEMAKIIIELENPEYLRNVGTFIEQFDVISTWMDSSGLTEDSDRPNQKNIFE